MAGNASRTNTDDAARLFYETLRQMHPSAQLLAVIDEAEAGLDQNRRSGASARSKGKLRGRERDDSTVSSVRGSARKDG